jgi:hypothetical protein
VNRIVACSCALAFLASCGGKLTIYEDSSLGGNAGTSVVSGSAGNAGGAHTGVGGTAFISTAGAGSNAGASGAGSTSGGAGLAGGASAFGGAAGFGGALSNAGDAGAAGESAETPCMSNADCPKPANACVAAVCSRGLCDTTNVPPRAMYLEDVPADCHATTACDGQGHATRVIDQNDVPTPVNPCLDGTCDNAGTPGTESVPAGTPCATSPGTVMCDGAGTCVECLHSRECPNNRSCDVNHQCVNAPCTDVDCGGVCPTCDNGKKCLIDADCTSNACDSVSLTCIANQCQDHRLDGLESDVDCGGGICRTLCALGHKCDLDTDCTSGVCDGLSLVCITDPCADHREDGQETDVDCGGPSCARCAFGRLCHVGSDCVSGRCSMGFPEECLDPTGN